MLIILVLFRDAEPCFAVGTLCVARIDSFGVERVAVAHEEQPQAVVILGAGNAGRVPPGEAPCAAGFCC